MLGVTRSAGRLRLLGRGRGGAGGGFLSIKSCYCDHSATQTSCNRSFTLSPFLQISAFGTCTQTKHSEADRALVSALPKNDTDCGEKVVKQKKKRVTKNDTDCGEKVVKQKKKRVTKNDTDCGEKVVKQKNKSVTKNDTDCGEKVVKQKNKRVTKVGDVINLPELFNEDKVHLIRYKDKKPVKAEYLEGKVIVLLFAPRCVTSESFQRDTKFLIDVYYELQPNGFDVVFVPPDKLLCDPEVRISAQEFFDRQFSWMPWAVIAYSDTASRRHVQRSLGVPRPKEELSTVYVIGPTGLVLQRDLEIFQMYGALGYPFTNERLEFLVDSEYDDIVQKPSLVKLLASPQRDYVITNTGDKVPIHTLEGKVVALYFYEETYTHRELTPALKEAYNDLAKRKENFEVVLIYTSKGDNSGYCPSERQFWKCFQTMPWLALPFRDLNEKKLVDIFEISLAEYCHGIEPPELVIFGPQGEFVEPHGADILFRFGTMAYPFTRKKVAEFHIEEVKKLKLEMLWNNNTIFSGNDGSQVPFSHFFGKRVILFVERLMFKRKGPLESIKIKFLKSLKEKYLQMKGTDEEFEVIHMLKIHPRYLSGSISTAESEAKSSAVKHIGDMPWLVSGGRKLLPADFDSYFWHGNQDDFKYNFSLVLAFDRDGRVVRRTSHPTVEDMNFPFYPGGLEAETLAHLNTYYEWNYWDNYPNKGRIYSIRDRLLKVSG